MFTLHIKYDFWLTLKPKEVCDSNFTVCCLVVQNKYKVKRKNKELEPCAYM